MNNSVIEYCTSRILPEWIADKDVLEVGSHNVNGSCQQWVKGLGPGKYIGVDINPGPGVDLVMDANNLLDHFEPDSFDFILSNECVEHVENWPLVFSNIKKLLKPGGITLITTRSKGFGYHAWPHDFWRYEKEDMEQIFNDMEILDLTKDWEFPGIFIVARKPVAFVQNDLSGIKLFSIVKWKKLHALSIYEVTDWDIKKNLLLYRLHDFKVYHLLPGSVKNGVKKWLFGKR